MDLSKKRYGSTDSHTPIHHCLSNYENVRSKITQILSQRFFLKILALSVIHPYKSTENFIMGCMVGVFKQSSIENKLLQPSVSNL